MEFRWKRQVAAGALTAAVFLIGSLSGPKQLFAQVKAAMVQDVDQPARQPFQATVQMGPGNLSFVAVPIPSGKRLVVEYVAINGAAASSWWRHSAVYSDQFIREWRCRGQLLSLAHAVR